MHVLVGKPIPSRLLRSNVRTGKVEQYPYYFLPLLYWLLFLYLALVPQAAAYRGSGAF